MYLTTYPLSKEAEVAEKLQGWDFGYDQVNKIVEMLPDVNPVSFTRVFIPDEKFRELTGAKAEWAKGAPRVFPDKGPYLVQVMKSSYFSTGSE